MHRLAQRDSFVDYRSRPVINYTVYLNNFPINAERHLVRLDFSIQNLSTNILLFYLYLLTYLLTYSSHDKTKRWPSFRRHGNPKLNSQKRRTRILSFFEPTSNSILSPLPSPYIQYSKRVKEREEPFPHVLLFTPRFIHGVRKREAWDTRASLVRRIGKHGQGRQARIE